jgi:PKD repeat protein
MISMILLLTLSLLSAASAQEVTNSGAITPNTVMTLQSEDQSGWLSFQKDVWNTGVTADRAPITDPMECPLSWEYQFSFGGWAGIDVNPVVSADRVYVVGADNHVYTFNRTTGSLLWEKSTSGSSFQLGTPGIGNGLLFVPTKDGKIFTFNTENGSEKWNKTISSRQLNTPVLYSRDKIYFGEAIGGHKYYCLNATTGDEIWNRTSTTQISVEGSYYWAGAALIGDILIYGDDDGHLVSVNKDTGTDISEINVSTVFGVSSGEIRSSVLYVEELERIYFTSKGGYCYGLGFNPAAGTFNLSDKYIASVGYTTSTPAYYNNRIYIGAGGMYGGGDGVSCLDADLTNEIWHYAAGAVQSSPVLSTYYDDGDGEVYIYFTVNDYMGGVYCLKDFTGCEHPTCVWSYSDSSKTSFTLQGVAVSDGWVYYGTDSKYLFGLTGPDPENPEVPVARFEADVTSGEEPLTVRFTDLSANFPTSWAWDFDNDGSVDSTKQNPSHTYTEAGVYTVKLTAGNSAGSDNETKTAFITVNEPAIVADFSVSPVSGDAPLTVQFTDLSTNSPSTWAWDFNNDGTVDSTEQNPMYTYKNVGFYSVKLAVSNVNGTDEAVRIAYIHANGSVDLNYLSATFLGGDAAEGTSVPDDILAVAPDGSIYITGSTRSANMPATSGAFQTVIGGGEDVFIAKYNADMTSLLACTYFGGTETESGCSIVVDNEGAVYITGYTYSSGLGTAGAFDNTYSNGRDAFVAKFDSSLINLLSCTYFGGVEHEISSSILLGNENNVYITGRAASEGLATAGAHDTGLNGYDGFVAEFDRNLSSLLACTYVGGSGTDILTDMCMNDNGDIYVTGYTTSSDVTTEGAYDSTYDDTWQLYDVLVARLDGSLATIDACTYLGGAYQDQGWDIEVGNDGSVYVIGGTEAGSTGLATEGAYDTDRNGDEGFLARFDPSLSSLFGCTYIGGNSDDEGYRVLIDDDRIWFVADVRSVDMPTTPDAFSGSNSGDDDIYLGCFDTSLSELLFGSYFGGTQDDFSHGFTFDLDGDLIIAGVSDSSDLPVENTIDGSHNGDRDMFISRWCFGNRSYTPVVRFSADITDGYAPLTVQFTDNSFFGPTSWAWDFDGDGTVDSTEQNPSFTYSTPGVYNMSVTVSNSAGSDTITMTGYISVDEPISPVADFSVDSISGPVPVTVHFIDQSLNSPTSWLWDFGDGSTSTEQNPTHVYSDIGEYAVSLTVSNSVGSDDEIKADYITGYIPRIGLLNSTYFGGAGEEAISDKGHAVAVADDGCIFIAGSTESADLPVSTNAFQKNNAGDEDMFIAKYSEDMSTLLACTYFGGSDDDNDCSIAIGSDGSVYIIGISRSSGLATGGAFDSTYEGKREVILAKFDNSLGALLACTYLGGSGHDYGYAISLADDGSVYAAGRIRSDGLATEGAFDTTIDGNDGFVARFDESLSSLIAFTYFGGSGTDYISSMCIGEDGNIYLAGRSGSDGLATADAYDTTFDGSYDILVASFDPSLSTLLNCTYLGGVSSDYGYDVALGSDGSVYTVGRTSSGDLATDGAFDTTFGIYGPDAIVARFDSSLSTLIACTYLGDDWGTEDLYSVLVEGDAVYLTGYTSSADMPVSFDAYSSIKAGSGGTDAILVQMDPLLANLEYGTFFGGASDDQGNSMVITESGLIVVGQTESTDLPMVNAADDTYGGSGDVFVSRWIPDSQGPDIPVLSFMPVDATVIDGQTAEIVISVESLPDGLSGYDLTVDIDDLAIAEIVDIEYPAWASITENSTLPGSSIYIKAVDGNDQIQAGATDVVLATLTVRGKETGNTSFTLGINRLDDDTGAPIEAILEIGNLEVTMTPVPGQSNSPQDLDGDGLYEDFTGDGSFSFVDVEVFFHQMDWIENNLPIGNFDYNGNGRIDFDDVVDLFRMLV